MQYTQQQLEGFREQWTRDERHAFSGWDFSYIDGRSDSDPLPWDYRSIVESRLKPADRLLDIGTGGGEFLLSLGHDPCLTSVTEDYAPNLELCREKLAPLGVSVQRRPDGVALPFDDDSFDVIIDRHEDFDAHELKRALRPGGCFITQQVGGRNNNALSRRLIPGFTPAFPDHTLEHNVRLLSAAGFDVLDAREAYPRLRFYDVGALAFFCRIIEWEFPGFSVDGAFDRLIDCQREIDRVGVLESFEHRFFIVAQALG